MAPILRLEGNWVNQAKELNSENNFYLTVYGREVIPDASTTNYGRKGSEYQVSRNPVLRERKRFRSTSNTSLKFSLGEVSMIDIICWKWKPLDGFRTEFKGYHVNVLYDMIKRNTTIPFNLPA